MWTLAKRYQKTMNCVRIRCIAQPSNLGVCSSTDRASDYGSEGWGFESLQAHFLYFGLTPRLNIGSLFCDHDLLELGGLQLEGETMGSKN